MKVSWDDAFTGKFNLFKLSMAWIENPPQFCKISGAKPKESGHDCEC